MAQWWNPFSWGKKKKEQQGPAPQFLKQYSWRDTTSGQAIAPKLEERLRGMGVGIPQNVLDEAEGPISTPYRRGFERYTKPAITSAASARGLGRTSIVPAQIGQKSQETEETIADKLARLRISNEELKRREIDNAIRMLYSGAQGEAGAASGTAALNRAEFGRQQGIRDERVDESNQDLTRLKALIGSGVSAAIPGGQGTALSLLSDAFGSGDYSKGSVNDLYDYYNLLSDGKDETSSAKKISKPSNMFQKYYNLFQNV